MFWHKCQDDVIMQTRKKALRIHVLFEYWKTQNFSRGKFIFYHFEKCADHEQ